MHPPTHVPQTWLICVTGWTRLMRDLVCTVMRWRLPCPAMVRFSCRDAWAAYREIQQGGAALLGCCSSTVLGAGRRAEDHAELSLVAVSTVRNRSFGSFIPALLRYFRHAWYNDSVLQPKGVVENLVKHAGWAAGGSSAGTRCKAQLSTVSTGKTGAGALSFSLKKPHFSRWIFFPSSLASPHKCLCMCLYF